MLYRKLVFTVLLMSMAFLADGQEIRWKRDIMDASRTGVTVPDATAPEEALGTVKGKTYTAPNGKVYRGGSVYKVAALVADAQPTMAIVKEVIGYSPEAMAKAYPESSLTNWYIDNFMAAVEEVTGKHVDIGIGNFGGVRVDLPAGNVIYDDIRSMFPFRNQILYMPIKGADIKALLDSMAAGRFQILGGIRVVAKDGKVLTAEIGGEPIDDEKIYGLATITFLMNGGDGLMLEKYLAGEPVVTDVDIFDAMMAQVQKATSAGEPITGKADGRVVIIKDAE